MLDSGGKQIARLFEIIAGIKQPVDRFAVGRWKGLGDLMQLTPIVRYIVGYHVGQFAPLGNEGKQLAA